jgi:hypothetical protein
MKKLSTETGGRVIDVGNKYDKLKAAFDQIAVELRSQYNIGYTPTNKERNGTFRKVEIKTKDKDYKIQSRSALRTQTLARHAEASDLFFGTIFNRDHELQPRPYVANRTNFYVNKPNRKPKCANLVFVQIGREARRFLWPGNPECAVGRELFHPEREISTKF